MRVAQASRLCSNPTESHPTPPAAPRINPVLCVGCGMCVQVCQFAAIEEVPTTGQLISNLKFQISNPGRSFLPFAFLLLPFGGLMTITNISLVGVGGQGILLASEVLSRAAMLAGRDVKKTEVHGMAQRGGSVVSQIRFGDRIFSPIIPDGETNVLVSFEYLESLRYADALAEGGLALINDQIITPVTVSSGQQPWPEDLEARLERAFPNRRVLDALSLAKDLGNLRTVNTIMTGALSCHLDLPETAWLQALEDVIPTRHREVNLRAFQAGRALLPA